MNNTLAGSDIHAGDGGYRIGTQQGYNAFVKQRNRGNNMNIQSTTQLLTTLKQLDKVGSAWLDTVPADINSVFYDNAYVDALQRAKDTALQAVFRSPGANDEISWFLYEWDANKDVSLRTITYVDGTTDIINTVQEFAVYLHKCGYIDE